jgi:hypothetical protein
VYFSTPPSFFFTKLTTQSQKKMNFPIPLHRKHCKEGATVVTQFWIHQYFPECYFISIIIHKNPKTIKKKFKIQKYIFLESTTSFHQNRVHWVNMSQTISTRVKNEFHPFQVKTVIFDQNRVHLINTGQTMSTRVKNKFHAVSGQNHHFRPKPSPGQYGSNHVDQDKK